MKHLFIAVVSLLIPMFLIWTCIYFSQGYNLTNNVARLDMASMINRFNNYLDTFSMNNMFIIRDKILNAFDDLWTYIGQISYGMTIYSSGWVKLVINVLNATYKVTNAILKPLVKVFGTLNYINKIIDNMLAFIVAFVKFALNPVFIPMQP